MSNKIRNLALGVIQRPDGSLLLGKGYDKIKDETFYRPMGGGIEFGETGSEALIRELKEEIDKEIIINNHIGTVENIFEFNGDPGHQIIFIYTCQFTNNNDYKVDNISRIDGQTDPIVWISLKEIEIESSFLYPDGLKDLLKSNH